MDKDDAEMQKFIPNARNLLMYMNFVSLSGRKLEKSYLNLLLHIVLASNRSDATKIKRKS